MNTKQLFISGLILVGFVIVAAMLIFMNPENAAPRYTQPANTTSSAAATSSSEQHPQAPIWGEYHINAPNALMLVDSQGRRTGKDPITGTIYREIPNTAYGEDESTPGHPTGDLFTSDLPNGKYSLYVLGGKTGAYGLNLSHYGQSDQTFQGTIQAGSMIAYVQNYDVANLASSTFSFSSSSSSTGSLTSAPPNNLPSPPPPKK